MAIFTWLLCVLVMGVNGSVDRGFKHYPTIVRTMANETVRLPCYVEDLDEIQESSVVWSHEGRVLVESNDTSLIPPERVKYWPNRTLEVFHLGPEDSGEYVCQVTRPAPRGRVTQIYMIEVLYAAGVEPVPESGEMEVNLGEEVDMACKPSGVPSPIVSWKMKDKEIPLLYDRPRLKFIAENKNLSGVYTCVASNGIGEPASASIDLRIRYKPEVQVDKAWVHATAAVGIRTMLKCKVNAWPEAKVDWYFNGKKISYSDRIVKFNVGFNHSLIIRNVESMDYGKYVCKASNPLGNAEAQIELTGVANPAVFKKESHAMSKNTFNFIWEVDSYGPIIEYQFWFRKYEDDDKSEWHELLIPSGSDAIGPVHARSFNLTGLEEATNYEAMVRSRNRYGWSETSKIFRFSTSEAQPYEPYETDDKFYEVSKEKIVKAVVHLKSSSTSITDFNTTSLQLSILILFFTSMLY